MHHAVSSSVWLNAYLHGDSDGDLIPDVLERCSGTPDLTRTVRQDELMMALPSDNAPPTDISSPTKLGFAKLSSRW